VLLLSLWWLTSWVARFGRESLQMDLSAFYTAGEALNHGLSPYRNHVAQHPHLWDGVDLFQHSRFLYPPQVAVLLSPLARLPYAAAKRLWMASSLAAVAVSLALTGQLYGLRCRWALILATAVFAALCYPLLTHLERGQIDAMTLLLIVLASVGMSERAARPEFHGAEFGAGVLFCVATLLKLHCVYMLPFLAIRKKGWALLGSLAGGLLIAALTVVAPGGIQSTLGYVQEEMPRIARFGEWGTDEMRLPKEVLEQRLQGLPDGATIKDGVVYKRESFGFVANGTVVRVLQRYLQPAGIWVSNSLLSALVLGGFWIAMIVWQLYQRESLRLRACLDASFGMCLDARGEFLYWQIVALIVLLSAPLTWVMNLVWLLPLIVVVLSGLSGPGSGRGRPALVFAAAALVVIALPDGRGAPWVPPTLAKLLEDKYVLGEGLLLVSLMGYLPRLKREYSLSVRDAS
jgi:hypothetical protein